MPTRAWPNYVHIREARLAVRSLVHDTRSDLNRRARYASLAADYWAGEILIADLGREDAHRFTAWLHDLEGRLDNFELPMAAGFLGASMPALADTTTTTVAAPRDNIPSAFAAGDVGRYIPRGCLVEVYAGDIDNAGYQVVEVLQGHAIAGTSNVTIPCAPRLRTAIPSGTALRYGGNARGRFRLASDDLDSIAFNLTRGNATLSIIEAM